MGDFLSTAWRSAAETASYLFAYRYVLVLAPAAHLALLALGPGRRGWLDGRRGPLAAVILGLTEPLSRSSFERNLRRLEGAGAVVTYLAVSHALTAYALVLLGPLLGKDFLLSHGVGLAVFVVVASLLARAAKQALVPNEPEIPEPAASTGRLLAGGALRFALLAALGLIVGGVVAAWGFSRWAWAPAELGAGGWWTQLSNGVLGLALTLLGVPPVANLFVATYLWKTGLAHAGIVAFFCAAAAAPTRWQLYVRIYGGRGAVRLVTILLAAALLAGLATAGVFAILELPIHYKLLPQQLWKLS